MASSAFEYYGEPDPIEQVAGTSRFFALAATALDRFSALPAYKTDIKLIPLDEYGGKRPTSGFLPSRQNIPKTTEAIALMASVCPDLNVGISSRRAVGGLLVVDCDRPGVVERIERETGRTLPLTYTTLTRPHSKPHKRHIYFQSTAHSVSRIVKQVTNVGEFIGYDLKGCGGWGYVATEGCIRDGETIVVLHDVPIVPIPDWLVDWLVADIAKGRALKRERELARKKPVLAKLETMSPRPFVVPKFKRTLAIKSRIRTWKNTGMSDDEIMPLLAAHIPAHFEDGEQMLTPDGVRRLRAMVREVPTLGAKSYSNLLRDRRSRHKSPLRRMREQLETAPHRLTSAEARQLLDIHTHADEQRMCRQLRRAHYVLLGSQGSHHRVWIRLRPAASVPLSLASSLSNQRAVAAQATRTTTSGSESEGFYVSQVVAGQEVADAALTLTFKKDGRSEKWPQRAVDEKSLAGSA